MAKEYILGVMLSWNPETAGMLLLLLMAAVAVVLVVVVVVYVCVCVGLGSYLQKDAVAQNGNRPKEAMN